MTNILLIFYPFVIYLSLRHGYINIAILALMIIFILRLLTLQEIFSQISWFIKVIPYLGLFLTITSWLFAKYQLLLYYPIIANFALFIVFSYSLKQSPTIIERFAMIQHPNLSKKAIKYARKVTICWCLFFIFNGSIALITCLLTDLSWWALYNGGISYLLIVALMGGEWLIRRKYQQ